MTDQHIEEIITPYQSQLGKVFIPYKNHVIRVAHFTLLLKKDLFENDERKIAIAAVFHDLGIWTEDTFDYLDPSRQLASQYLEKHGLETWAEEIDLMIDNHHKIGRFKYDKLNGEQAQESINASIPGKPAQSIQDNVEAFRRADLLDLTKGMKAFGITRKTIKDQYLQYPMMGFRSVIIRRFFKNLLRHPFRPLPMMKR